MNKNKLNVAILGGGINSAVGSAHISALLLSNRFNIVAGSFSRNSEINKTTAELYNIEKNRFYKNLDDLIIFEKDNIDCIIILTPTDQHVSQVLQCIEANINVICEKALASSVSEIELIKSKLIEKKGFLSVIYNYLGYPIVRELKDIIQKEIIGKISQIQIEMPQEGFSRLVNGIPLKPQSWRLSDINVPVISLDLGVHLHMIIKYLINQSPKSLVSTSQSFGNFSNIIDNVNCLILYDQNIICNMWYSKVALGYRNGLKIRIFGDKGSAEWYQENAEILLMAKNDGQKLIIDRGSNDINVANLTRYSRFKVGHPAGFIEALANYYVDCADDIFNFILKRKFEKITFGIDEALEGLKMFESIDLSSKDHTWQNV